MKRILSALLGISVAATMAVGLTGCDMMTAGNDKLVWYCIGEKPEDHDMVMEEVNKIVEPELGLKLDIQYIDAAAFTEKTKLMMSSNEPYDLVFTGYVNNYQAAVQMGGLLDITDMMDNITMKDGTKVKMSDAVEDYFIEAALVDGRVYGIPNTQVVSNPTCLQMSKRVAEATGFDYERLDKLGRNNNSYETMVEYLDAFTEELAKIKAKENTDLGYKYTMKPYNPATYAMYEEIAGGISIRKDGTSDELVIACDTPEWKYGKQTVRKWYELGYIRNDMASAAAMESSDSDSLYATSATTWKPGQEVYYINQYGEEPVYSFFGEPNVWRTGPLATMISVNARTQHPEEAVKMIYMLNSNKELFNLIVWGIEGKHYKLNEDGTAKTLEGSGYDIASGAWRYGNQFNGYVMEGQPADVWEQTKKMNDESVKSPVLGFVPDTTEISAEIANISAVGQEYKAYSEYGVAPFEEWYDAYRAKLTAAGIEKVRDELQKQYDAWKAEQN